jgi:hypothetical protein
MVQESAVPRCSCAWCRCARHRSAAPAASIHPRSIGSHPPLLSAREPKAWRLRNIHDRGPGKCNTLVWLCWVSLCSAPQCWASPCSAPQCCTRSQHSSAQHWLTPLSPHRIRTKSMTSERQAYLTVQRSAVPRCGCAWCRRARHRRARQRRAASKVANPVPRAMEMRNA